MKNKEMKTRTFWGRVAPYALAVVLCLALGWVASMLQREALAEWYPSLAKSPLTPPGIVFPLAWSALYVLIGIAFGAAWHASAESRGALLGWWGVQCVLNFLWSVSFFYARSPWAGMVVIVALLVAVVVFMVKSRRACRVAFGCFVPYLLWLAFAAYLNAYVCLYN